MILTIATHNLLDGAAPATDIARVIFFTESWGASRVRLRDYNVYTCHQQRDLMIAVDKQIRWTFIEHYKQSVWGRVRVTPNRGTYYLVDNEAKVVLIDEHRINAAFPPYIRGEKLFRKAKWWLHTRRTLRIIKRYKRKGYTIHAGGDLNTPHGVSGYRGHLHEVGDHFDRLGSTKPLRNVRVMAKLGSDHNGLRAVV
jgi:hypothetical protein